MRMSGFPEGSLEILEEGARLSKELGDTKNRTMLCSLIAKFYAFRGEPLRGLKYQENCMEQIAFRMLKMQSNVSRK